MSSFTKAGSKRKASEHLDAPSNVGPTLKVAKIHSFFGKKTEPTLSGSYKWLDPLGPALSCLHGVNLNPKPSTKVAAFDLDGTLIKSDFGIGSSRKASTSTPTAAPSWEWWRASIPAKLKEVIDSGFTVVIISNQALKPAALKAWKLKISSIAAALPDVPFRLFAASAKDGYRKPMPGMWTELERIFVEDGVTIDKAQSFFVGDAAGRQYTGTKSDFSSTDRKWALNVDISFLTPEEYFLKLPPHTNFTLPGFNVSSLPTDLPTITPTSSPLLPHPPKQELVLFVGYPCLGKTTFFRSHFEPAGYIHINQDTLKTRDKCVKEMQRHLQDGKSCVIDNTNRNATTRKYYVDVANQLKVSTRCFYFMGSIELAWHNNLYRTFNLPPSVATVESKRELVPYIGFSGFRDSFEGPSLEEGFREVKKVNWVFKGTLEEKKYWSMWLQIDGK
ncbi:hypothetical protein DXG03_009469 [Asterophora parasitica]|uniref:PNK3P-domain-containing protein n=1 Tax=Asterophora parasitica TaxID=117018 RepID=A0A9P7G5F4_9AGAR|nr:hypothetical protein DXG03_009469 [Asterophora parasitica]